MKKNLSKEELIEIFKCLKNANMSLNLVCGTYDCILDLYPPDLVINLKDRNYLYIDRINVIIELLSAYSNGVKVIDCGYKLLDFLSQDCSVYIHNIPLDIKLIYTFLMELSKDINSFLDKMNHDIYIIS